MSDILAEKRTPEAEGGASADPLDSGTSFRIEQERRERAESASAAKSRFLAMVSHEVRTPLNGILGITQLLAGTRLTAEQQSYVDAVRHSGHALLALIEDLLDFSSMEAGKFHLRPEPGNLRQLVGHVVELSASRADEKNIEIAAYVAPDVPETIVADHGRLRQVLFNLVGNALKFTEQGGVFVEVAMDGDRVDFRVTDSGPGLDPADQARIFEEFERVDSDTTRRSGGAGLGLAISARLVAAMGGTIGVRSKPGAGSTFSFAIPSGAARGAPVIEENKSESLARSRVLLIAPSGPTEEALLRIVRDHGGAAESAQDSASAREAVARLAGGGALTDIIVDNRLAEAAEEILATVDLKPAYSFRRTMMVTPADRAALTAASARSFTAWLIRPLRIDSLVKVLNRETGGLGTWLEEREAFPEPGRRGALAGPASSRPLSILLAEDNPVNALLVRSALQRAGHRVTHVTNGKDLVERTYDRQTCRSAFDVVLTDLSMPLLDGIGAVKAIRAFERNQALSQLPVIVLSADGQNESRAEALASGAGDYVEKPVDPDILLETIERAAAQRAASSASG